MDVMDVQIARDMVIQDPTQQIIKGQKDGLIYPKRILGNRKQVAVYSITGDVNVSEIASNIKGGKKANLRQGKTDSEVGEKYISHNQLKFRGYINEKSDPIKTYNGETYIIDRYPKKMVNLSENEIRWSRALFEATRSEYMDPSAHMNGYNQFKKEADALRVSISTGYSGAIKNALANRILSKDIYEMQAIREGLDIKRFLDKWAPEVHSNVDPVDLILRYLLQPQLADTYALGKNNQYTPSFKTNLHLQKTIMQWTLDNERLIEFEYGGEAGFVKNLMKDVQNFYSGKKRPNIPEWESAQKIGIDYEALGELANPVKSLSRYLDIFFASPLIDRQLNKRINTTRNRIIMEQGPNDTFIPTIKGKVIDRYTKPGDVKGRYHDIETGGKNC